MATDFWSSSHCKRWLVDRATLRQARADDVLYVDAPEHLAFLNIFFANLIAKLGKKLSLRQRVIATATVFFRRFYLKNSYCETDPFLVAAACCYVAAKAEESPVHIKSVVSDARALFADEYGIKSFPADNAKLAEMEFYLVDELDCDLTVFHPYRALMALCSKNTSFPPEAEAGQADDAMRGTPEGKLPLGDVATQTAWFIITDTYRTELCLLYPPHLIAIAAIYLTLVFNTTARAALSASAAFSTASSASSTSSTSTASSSNPPPDPSRRSSRSSSSSSRKHPPTPHPPDLIGWLAGLNVSMSLVATLAQEIIALYALWDRYDEDAGRPQRARHHLRSDPAPTARDPSAEAQADVVTPAFLVDLLLRMRQLRMADLAHPASGRPVAVNKMLERTQAAG